MAYFLARQRMPTVAFGVLAAGIVGVNGGYIEGMVWQRDDVGILQLPDKNRVGAFVHIGKTVLFPKAFVVTEGSARNPGTASGRVNIFPGTVAARIVKQEMREAAERGYRMRHQLFHLI